MTAINLEPHPHGVILPVWAQPGARRPGVVGVQAGALKVAVTQAAEKGKANEALVALLAGLLGMKKRDLELIGGETARRKRILVRGATAEQLLAAIRRELADCQSTG